MGGNKGTEGKSLECLSYGSGRQGGMVDPASSSGKAVLRSLEEVEWLYVGSREGPCPDPDRIPELVRKFKSGARRLPEVVWTGKALVSLEKEVDGLLTVLGELKFTARWCREKK